MKYTFLFGPSGSGKTTQSFRRMVHASEEEPEKHFFVIVPEQYSMLMQKRILELHPRHASGNLEVMSFNRLAWRVFAELSVRNPEVLDDTGKAMLLRKAASEHASELRVWGGKLKKAGFTEHVKSMISELYQYGVKPEDLKKAAESDLRLPLRMKLSDLSLLYEAFDDSIRDRALTTEQVLHVFAAVAEKSSLLRGAVFLFDAFTGFTPVQYALIEKLLLMADQISFNVTLGSGMSPYRQCGEEELFRMSTEMAGKIREMGIRNGLGPGEDHFLTERPRFACQPELGFLEQHFLRYDGAEYPEVPQGIRVMESQDPAGEAERTACEILRLVKEKGYRYREIAVITADMEDGGALLCHEFRRQGIPFYMDRNLNVSANPLPELLRAALNCVTERYSAGAFLRFLKSSLVPGGTILKAECENYMKAAGIRGYRRLSAPWTYLPASEQGTDLSELNGLKDGILRLLEPLRILFEGGSAGVGSVVRELRTLMEETGAEEALKQRKKRFAEECDAEHEREYERVFEETVRILSEMEELLGDEQLNREEMNGILETGLNEIRVGQIPAFADRVQVGDLTRTRLGEIRVLFLMGANDGLLPSLRQKNGVLTDREKMALKELGITLAPTAREDLCTQRYYLYRMVTSPSERLYLSYALYDRAGKTLRPSGILMHLLRLFPELKKEASPGGEALKPLKAGACPPDQRSGAETEEPLFSGLQAERLLVRGLRTARDGEILPELRDLLTAENTVPEKKKLLLVDAATFFHEDRLLGRAAARALYGEFLYGNVTRIETFFNCPMRHFLKYGLNLKEEREYAFTGQDAGTLSHRAMELVFSRAAAEGRMPGEMKEEERDAFVQECVDEAVRGDESGLYEDSARNRYLVKKLCGIVKKSVKVMEQQRMRGDFRPYALEESLASGGERPVLLTRLSGGEWMRLGGRPDRIDIAEEGGMIALKIIDYKTGNVKWEPYRILSGSQLQLILYLDAAAELLKQRFPEKEIVPAAVLYMKLQDPWLKRTGSDTPELIEKLILKELKPSGLVNIRPEVMKHLCAVPEEAPEVLPVKQTKTGGWSGDGAADEKRFTMLRNYVRKKAKEAGEQIYDGKMSPEPLQEGANDACTWCSYSAVCGFDLKCPGFRGNISLKIKPEEVFRVIEEEEEQKNA